MTVTGFSTKPHSAVQCELSESEGARDGLWRAATAGVYLDGTEPVVIVEIPDMDPFEPRRLYGIYDLVERVITSDIPDAMRIYTGGVLGPGWSLLLTQGAQQRGEQLIAGLAVLRDDAHKNVVPYSVRDLVKAAELGGAESTLQIAANSRGRYTHASRKFGAADALALHRL